MKRRWYLTTLEQSPLSKVTLEEDKKTACACLAMDDDEDDNWDDNNDGKDDNH